MRTVLAPRSRTAALVLLAVVLCAPVRAGADDRFGMDVTVAYRLERFHAREADSLGRSLTRGTMAELAYDFRVLEAPMPAAPRPAVHVFGHATLAKRAFGTEGIAAPGTTTEPVREAPMLDLGTGVALHIPLDILDHGAGSALFVSYEGGLAMTGTSSYDFIRLKRLAVGFRRTRGLFEGSQVELGYGRNEIFGMAHAAKRWSPRFRLQSGLVPSSLAPRAGATRAAAAKSTPFESPVHAFLEVTVDTDGRSGPDGIQALFGLTLDSGSILRRIMGATE